MTPEESKLSKQGAEQVSEQLKHKAEQARKNKSQLDESYERYGKEGGQELHKFYSKKIVETEGGGGHATLSSLSMDDS